MMLMLSVMISIGFNVLFIIMIDYWSINDDIIMILIIMMVYKYNGNNKELP